MTRDEDNQKFRRLAEKRTNKAIKMIWLIGNLSNRSNYKYTDSDVKKIMTAIRNAVDEVEKVFLRKKKTQFKLED